MTLTASSTARCRSDHALPQGNSRSVHGLSWPSAFRMKDYRPGPTMLVHRPCSASGSNP